MSCKTEASTEFFSISFFAILKKTLAVSCPTLFRSSCQAQSRWHHQSQQFFESTHAQQWSTDASRSPAPLRRLLNVMLIQLANAKLVPKNRLRPASKTCVYSILYYAVAVNRKKSLDQQNVSDLQYPTDVGPENVKNTRRTTKRIGVARCID